MIVVKTSKQTLCLEFIHFFVLYNLRVFVLSFFSLFLYLYGGTNNHYDVIAVVKASDGAEIEVTLPPGETFESKYVQILGNVKFLFVVARSSLSFSSLFSFKQVLPDRIYCFPNIHTFVGKVTKHGCIDATRVQSAGENFHMENYEQALNLISDKYKSMFE